MSTPEPLRVLIVDDSPDDVVFITEAITEPGATVVTVRVEKAADLRRKLAAQKWDVVLSDYSMPSMTVREVLDIVRESDVYLPLIVVSGVIAEDAAVEMMRAGAVDYVMKDRLQRLLPAIRREMREVRIRVGRDQAEEVLYETRKRLETTVERAPVGIANVGRDGRFLHVNPKFCEMLGYAEEELQTLTFSDLTHPDDGAGDFRAVHAMLNGQLHEYRTEKRYRRKDGVWINVSLNTAPVHDAAGQFQYFASILLDVTEKKEMEVALRERDQRYRQIVDTAEEGIWTIGVDDCTTFVNRTMAAMLGYSAEEMLGRPLSDFIHARDVEAAEARAGERWQGLAGSGEIALRHKNGGSIRIHYTANALVGSDGAPSGALAMVTDVTARWKAEKTVLLQRQELIEAQRIANLGSFRRDLPGERIEWSEQLYRIYGVDPSAQPTLSLVMQLVLPEDRRRFASTVARASEHDRPFDMTYRIQRPDGAIRVVHSFGEVLRDADGVPSCVRGVAQDVTDSVAAAEVHSKLNRHLQLLLQSTTQGIFGIDREGRCTFINRAASELLGYPPEKLVGEGMHDKLHRLGKSWSCVPSDCSIATAVQNGAATEVQSGTLYRRDRASLPVEFSAAPILDEGSVTGAVVVFTDVSERKLLQAQLEQSDRVSSLGRLAASMAHEFNNVLMGIQPFAELLARRKGEESTVRATTNILQAVQRGRSITSDILRFARPAELARENLDIAQWIQTIQPTLAAILGSSRLTVRADREALVVRGDRHQLEQVLTNLAANARDAMPLGGKLTIVVQRCLSGNVFPFGVPRTVDRFLHISVSDTGCGMDAKTLKGMFDPFFTTKRSGTGLGLAIVHQIVELHGGNVVAESTPGRGTTFHLFLPLSEEAEVRAVTEVRPAGRLRIRSILMVEDDAAISTGVADLLRDEGVVVEVAACGAMALASLATHVPDALILDVGLPDMDGRYLYAHIAAMHPDLAIIFASGSSDEEMLKPYLRGSKVASLRKPYEFQTLLRLLGTLDIAPARLEAVSA